MEKNKALVIAFALIGTVAVFALIGTVAVGSSGDDAEEYNFLVELAQSLERSGERITRSSRLIGNLEDEIARQLKEVNGDREAMSPAWTNAWTQSAGLRHELDEAKRDFNVEVGAYNNQIKFFDLKPFRDRDDIPPGHIDKVSFVQ